MPVQKCLDRVALVCALDGDRAVASELNHGPGRFGLLGSDKRGSTEPSCIRTPGHPAEDLDP